MKKINFQYQVKVNYDNKDEWLHYDLFYNCDPNKTDKENLDRAFEKACSLGCDPNKDVKWEFIDDNN